MNLEHRLLKTGGVVGGRPPARGACVLRVLLERLVRWGAEERPASFWGVSSTPWAWSFSRARARSSDVAFRARRAEPSAALERGLGVVE